ncbi:hypothetical protein [Methylovirgula sp. 4M-Z18]|uniref:hypothetical protein n=1 Tax=Methylovirgula sp. 4M-Z18 TaxID=2293567 RepID=UPI000E2F068F|nr:hypothetical protein [Methylovirgula sp. 4M-Z18]RFB78476.1 hypothetical protein DYH55_17045 [Methylovirgula sp. 4M-Z18]
MIVSASMGRLLSGLAKFVQHPGVLRIFWPHVGWAVSMLIFLLHFLWWEIHLRDLVDIDFLVFAFVTFYGCLLFFLCTLLFPDTLAEYNGYEDYFLSRRRVFFGLLAFAYVIDIIDTALKGQSYFASLGLEYPIRNAVYVTLCIAAIFVASRRFHLVFASIGLIYQISWIVRAYDTMQ